MKSHPLDRVDRTLTLVSAACEQAAAAARELPQDADPRLAAALREAERELTATYNTLWREAFAPAAPEQQLRLAG